MSEINKLLNGQVQSGQFYAFYGKDKMNEVCATILCKSYLPIELGGLVEKDKDPHKTVWIDVDEYYRYMTMDREVRSQKETVIKPSAMKKMCQDIGLNFENDVKTFVTRVEIKTIDDVFTAIDNVQNDVRILIIGSIDAVFSRCNIDYKDSHTNIEKLLKKLQQLKSMNQLSVLFINRVYIVSKEIQLQYFGEYNTSNEIPFGKRVMFGIFDKNVHIWKGSDGNFNINIQENEEEPIQFRYTDNGIKNV